MPSRPFRRPFRRAKRSKDSEPALKKLEQRAARPRRAGGRVAAVAATAATSASWMALVAATTLGLGSLDRVRAQVSARPHSDGVAPGGAYRLIVQSYGGSVAEGGPGAEGGAGKADWLPGRDARPLASTQRAITRDELEKGIAVDVVSVGQEAIQGSALVVAWVEPGVPDLELDGLEARPAPGAYYGVSELDASEQPQVQLVLDRRVG